MSTWFYNGFQFGCGLFACLLVFILVMSFFNSHDSTDEPGKRSGVIVVTDAKTGMQYLRTPGGGITPRIDAECHQMRADQ